MCKLFILMALGLTLVGCTKEKYCITAEVSHISYNGSPFFEQESYYCVDTKKEFEDQLAERKAARIQARVGKLEDRVTTLEKKPVPKPVIQFAPNLWHTDGWVGGTTTLTTPTQGVR